MAKSYTVPLVNAQVVRDPMCKMTKQVPAHEVFVLMNIHPEVHVFGPVRDERGRPVTRQVDAGEEYERLARAYGRNNDTEQLRVLETFGPDHGRGWREALEAGLDNFDMGDESDGEDEAGGESPTESPLVRHIQQMMLQDPDRERDEWWVNDGRPEVAELRRRMNGARVSATERDAAYEQVLGVINIEAVKARLAELDIDYDDEAPAEVLVEVLRTETASQIEALGGEVGEDASLEALSAKLDELREANG